MISKSNKKPTLTADLAGLSLQVGTPSQTGMQLADPVMPAPGMFLTLPTMEVDFFEHNPRRWHDDVLYGQIKESIRSVGVQQPVHVTLRPGAQRYILAKGGNTRLKIMQELYTETGDDRYRTMPCLYTPYTNETDLHIAHVVENEQRAEMCFWDKANAYVTIRDQLQQNHIGNSLSLRDIESLFQMHGLSVSYAALSNFFFAAEKLDALGIYAVQLSHPKVSEIRKIYSSMQDAATKLNTAVDFDAFFQQAIGQWHDTVPSDKELDVQSLKQYLLKQFDTEFGTQEMQLPFPEPGKSDVVSDMPEATNDHSKDQPKPSDGHGKTPSFRSMSASNHTSRTLQAEPLGQIHSPGEMVATTALPTVNPAAKPVIPPTSQASTSPQTCIKQLHTLIRQWLAEVKLGHCFVLNNNFPYGFYLEYPAFESIPIVEGCVYPVDALHPDAGNVFVFISKVIRQEAFLYQLDGKDNPILSLPASSKLRIAYYDPDKLDEYTHVGIGDRNDLLLRVLDWQITGHSFAERIHNMVAL